jgi:hypothetical protein
LVQPTWLGIYKDKISMAMAISTLISELNTKDNF